MKKLQNYLVKNSVEAIVITELANIRYWSGFSGSNAMLIVSNKCIKIITDFRYDEQVRQELTRPAQVVIATEGMDKALFECLQEFESVAFEGDYLTASQFLKYKEELASKKFSLLNIDFMRAVKSAKEVAHMRRAASIANIAFEQTIKELKIGMTELEVAALLEYNCRMIGAAGMSFSTIVASGMHSAMPHAHPTSKPLEYGNFVVIDFGVVYEGYCSDMTRTIVMGRASEEQKHIYGIVLQAQQTALQAVKQGATASSIDTIARDIIKNAGYGEQFGHSTGHGVGLHIHEYPRLHSASKDTLKAGMAITIEPGIYVTGMGGVRIEDLVIVTKDGSDVLTADISKELLEI